jgi:hypothetical protein
MISTAAHHYSYYHCYDTPLLLILAVLIPLLNSDDTYKLLENAAVTKVAVTAYLFSQQFADVRWL